MPKPICDYPGCELEAATKCSSCGKVFCIKHIAWIKDGQQWLCAQDLKGKAEDQKQIAVLFFGVGIVGIILMAFAGANGSGLLGALIGGVGFGIGLPFGIKYSNTKTKLMEIFPEQEITKIDTTGLSSDENPLDVYQQIFLSTEEATNGSTKTIQLEDRKLQIKTPSRVKIGTKIKISGNGKKSGELIGDLYLVVVIIDLPESKS